MRCMDDNEWWACKNSGRMWLWFSLGYCPGIYLEVLSKLYKPQFGYLTMIWFGHHLNIIACCYHCTDKLSYGDCHYNFTNLCFCILLLLQNWMLCGQKYILISHCPVVLLLKLSGGSKILEMWIRLMSK